MRVRNRRENTCFEKILGRTFLHLYYGGSDDALGLPFDNPKPVAVASKLIESICKPGEIVMDFFAGSATTAHAVIQLNAEDGGNRSFILVQLPEPCANKTIAEKTGFPNIAEISKERIRRAGKKIIDGNFHEEWNKDVGFRVLKSIRRTWPTSITHQMR
jgi:adenine-specific DNA-methyltransferase